ncbi:SH3 domain-containing protein (plasmid) [Bacillus cereus]|uniref:SH3 domain-containing protein n=2 Tax=Bacillus cereus group TaxID=86661 RepID=UPI0007448F62|nr:SH3 domain-containing protein [Bacillus cereus]ALZ64595.1 SH3 domain-containing protein [Bacillus cereus]OTX43924.1 enterotoxin [Bacillus thuringiensis serovar malayensis]OUB07947.1 enterotoxin [Bacillus thuringiensis serovar shandongiensis]
MRRLSKYITTVALASTGVGIAAGTVQAAENNKVNVDVLNIRATSSISGSIAGKLYNGNPVSVLENMANGWSKINHNGKIAYVKTEFISTTHITKARTYRVNINILNVRSGAGTNFKVMGILSKNQTITILDSTKDWYKIKFNGKDGYVKGSYLTAEDSVRPDNIQRTTFKETANENNIYKTNVNVLNIRSIPSTAGNIVGKLYNGNPVNVLENMANGWSKINHNGKIAYVKTEFITNNQPLQLKKSESVHPKGKAVVNKYFDVLSPLIEEEAARNDISEWVELLKAITMQESTGNYIKYPDVMQSSEGACGTIRCISDYKKSIENGVAIFKKRVEAASRMFNGDIRMGIQAYNYGPNFLKKAKEWGATEYSQELSQRYSQYLRENYGFGGDPLYVKHVLSRYLNQ